MLNAEVTAEWQCSVNCEVIRLPLLLASAFRFTFTPSPLLQHSAFSIQNCHG
jgi:hypothetical protein